MLELWQAEWCPYSHTVRERLTELGITYVIHQAAPDHEGRDELRRLCGDDSIPVLVTEDGEAISGTDAILEHLESRYPDPPEADGHRQQAEAHAG